MNDISMNRLLPNVLASLREKVRSFNFEQFVRSQTDNFVEVDENERTVFDANNPDYEEEEVLDYLEEEEISDYSDEEILDNPKEENEEILDNPKEENEEILDNSKEEEIKDYTDEEECDFMAKAINKRKKNKKHVSVNEVEQVVSVKEEPVDAEPVNTEEPVVLIEEQQEETTTAKPEEEKQVEQIDEESTSAEPEPVDEEPTSEQVNEEPTAEQVNKEPEEEPVLIEEKQTEPDTVEPETIVEPIAEEPVSIEDNGEAEKSLNEIVDKVIQPEIELTTLNLKECYDACKNVEDIIAIDNKVLIVLGDKFSLTDNLSVNIISTVYSTLDRLNGNNKILTYVLTKLRETRNLLTAMQSSTKQYPECADVINKLIDALK